MRISIGNEYAEQRCSDVGAGNVAFLSVAVSDRGRGRLYHTVDAIIYDERSIIDGEIVLCQ